MNKSILYILILATFSCYSNKAFGQCGTAFPFASDSGTFNVTVIRGCAPLQVDICINSTAPSGCTGTDSCDFLYGDGSDEGSDKFQNIYTEPGNYRLEIVYPDASDFINITVTDSDAPQFEVYACAGNSVTVDIQDTQYDTYSVDFGDGTTVSVPFNNDPQHTYTSTATRTITVQGVDNNARANCPTSSVDFTPQNTIPPLTITQLAVLDESNLELTYSPEENLFYRLEIQVNGTGNFNFVKNIAAGSSPDTIPNLDLVNNFYCFRIGSIDPCSNSVTYSNTICSIIANLEIENANNAITWTTSNPSSDFGLARQVENENGNTTLNPYLTFNNNTRSHNDMDIFCNSLYCYFLEAEYDGGVSISNEVCGISISTNAPDSVSDLSIIVNETETLLDWPEDTNLIDNYEVRAFSSLLDTTTVTNFTDLTRVANTQSNCYIVITTDDCGNTNSTDEICSIFLSGTISADNVVDLSWNEYSGYQNGVNLYLVEKFYGADIVDSRLQAETTFTEVDDNPTEQVLNYRVSAVPFATTLPESAASNILTIVKPNNIYHPTAFTPDGNDTNEVFTVNARFLTSYQMQIFNRWGELIFSSDTPENGWDGTVNGQPQHEGTYIFNLEIIDLAGRQIKDSGSFVLIRR